VDDFDCSGALQLSKELKETLGWYDIKTPGETSRVDRLDHTLKLLDFLQNQLEQKHRNRTWAKHYAQSVLKILN
jgi:hypothetical protein